MSGETSKKIGELGECLAKRLLIKIGWKNTMHNIPIDCINPRHFNDKGNKRTTHGEDVIFMYHNPFHDDRTDIVHVSVKYVGKYPSGATLKTKFKEHLKELHEIIDCSKSSSRIKSILDSFRARKNKFHVGALIWLHNDNDSPEFDIKSDLENARIEQDNQIPVYLIDNKRASFLLKVVCDLKIKIPDAMMEFYYPKIGTVIGQKEARRGRFIPLEIIASDIVPILVTRNKKSELFIYADQKFSYLAYLRLIAYALHFCDGLIRSAKIVMPDYNAGVHENDARQARLAFDERDEDIEPLSFNQSLFDLLEESDRD